MPTYRYTATVPATGATDTKVTGSPHYTHAVISHQVERPAIVADVTRENGGITTVTYWPVREGWKVQSWHTSEERAGKAAAALLRTAARFADKVLREYGQEVPPSIDRVEVVPAVLQS